MNNYEFWGKYLEDVKRAISKKCRTKDTLQIDLHIHSTYSADGRQTIGEILESTKELGFDIISITDHDTLNAYDELYEYVKDGLTDPIVVPGIEFTIDHREYGNQCHMLQLFLNPKDKTIMKDVETNYKALFKRSKKQFKRIHDNLALTEIIKKNKIKISYDNYIDYLEENNMCPEYDTLMSYLMKEFKKKKITCFDVLSLLEKYNQDDPFADRREIKRKQYQRLRGKYPMDKMNEYNIRFLLSMLAPREVDDDWWDSPSSGSLSVNSFGQLKVGDINDKYDIYFAHPTEKSLPVVDQIIKGKKNLIGMELNKRCPYKDINHFYTVLKDNHMIQIIGSDSHDSSLQFYDDLAFYRIKSGDVKKIIER